MKKSKRNPMEIERMHHQVIIGKSGTGWGYTVLSEETVAGLVSEGVKFVKGDSEIILTKKELINEFKVGLQKGFFKKEDLFD